MTHELIQYTGGCKGRSSYRALGRPVVTGLEVRLFGYRPREISTY